MPLPIRPGKEGIVLYSSRTGYTKRYAEHIAQELGFAIKPIQKANLFSVSCYSTIIYGGGLHHDRIDGIKGLIDGFEYFGDQSLIVFSVGLASINPDLAKQIKDKNFDPSIQGDFLYFSLPGGLSRSDCMGSGAMAAKIAEYRTKREEGKKLTRGDKIALAIADGETPDHNRFDVSACDPIIAAARMRNI